MTTATASAPAKMKYITNDGLSMEGSLEQISAFLKKTGETIDLARLSGFDEKKYYKSETKGELILIETMPTPYIMNAVIRKIKDYYNNLSTFSRAKGKEEITIGEFFVKLQGFVEIAEIKHLISELNKRNK